MARVVVAHQECLLGPSDKLRRIGETCYEKSVFAYPPPEKPADLSALSQGIYLQHTQLSLVEQKSELREKQILAARVELEYGLLYSLYKSSTRALEHFKQAMRASGLRVQLSGALGRRTK